MLVGHWQRGRDSIELNDHVSRLMQVQQAISHVVHAGPEHSFHFSEDISWQSSSEVYLRYSIDSHSLRARYHIVNDRQVE